MTTPMTSADLTDAINAATTHWHLDELWHLHKEDFSAAHVEAARVAHIEIQVVRAMVRADVIARAGLE